LDSASQTYFITEGCVQRLKMSKTHIHASIQGMNNVNTAASHSVSVHLRSRITDWHAIINCAILSNITTTTSAAKLDISKWNIPKNLKLADENFNVPGDIDLLIGADIFYEILRSENRTRPGNYPVLQETALGWTISGRTPATATPCDKQHTFLLRNDNSLEQNLNRFWKVKQWSNPQ
jgi:hypothetical protein